MSEGRYGAASDSERTGFSGHRKAECERKRMHERIGRAPAARETVDRGALPANGAGRLQRQPDGGSAGRTTGPEEIGAATQRRLLGAFVVPIRDRRAVLP